MRGFVQDGKTGMGCFILGCFALHSFFLTIFFFKIAINLSFFYTCFAIFFSSLFFYVFLRLYEPRRGCESNNSPLKGGIHSPPKLGT